MRVVQTLRAAVISPRRIAFQEYRTHTYCFTLKIKLTSHMNHCHPCLCFQSVLSKSSPLQETIHSHKLLAAFHVGPGPLQMLGPHTHARLSQTSAFTSGKLLAFFIGPKQPFFVFSQVPHISVSKVQDKAVLNRIFVRVNSHEQADGRH